MWLSSAVVRECAQSCVFDPIDETAMRTVMSHPHAVVRQPRRGQGRPRESCTAKRIGHAVAVWRQPMSLRRSRPRSALRTPTSMVSGATNSPRWVPISRFRTRPCQRPRSGRRSQIASLEWRPEMRRCPGRMVVRSWRKVGSVSAYAVKIDSTRAIIGRDDRVGLLGRPPYGDGLRTVGSLASHRVLEQDYSPSRGSTGSRSPWRWMLTPQWIPSGDWRCLAGAKSRRHRVDAPQRRVHTGE
jgi:hypothetical protein